MYKFLNIILFTIFLVSKSYAEIINKVEIINNERITKETIIGFSNIQIGKDHDANNLDQVIKDLYGTNFFSNISLSLINGVLTIDVTENKIIQEITINGIKKNELVNILKKQLLLKDKNPFVENFVKADVERIQKILKNSGYYFSNVTDKVINNSNNTVNLVFEVDLGEKAFIKTIEFTGDKYYKDRLLRNIIISEENRFWKFITNRKFINPENIKLDKRLLKNYYLNKGHYQVLINDSNVELTENNYFKLQYNINAGPFNWFALKRAISIRSTKPFTASMRVRFIIFLSVDSCLSILRLSEGLRPKPPPLIPSPGANLVKIHNADSCQAGRAARPHIAGAIKIVPSCGGRLCCADATITTAPPMLSPSKKSGTPGCFKRIMRAIAMRSAVNDRAPCQRPANGAPPNPR